MRRRDLLAGLGSTGVLAGAGAIAVYGLPSVEDAPAGDDASPSERGDGTDAGANGTNRPDPIEVETIEAPGSEAGTVTIPTPGRPTFVDLFGTWCAPCIEQMPGLAAANDRIGDEVQFVSVTSEPATEDHGITEAELVDWWTTHDGDWTLGVDPTAKVMGRHFQGSYPTAVAFDATGRVQWADDGIKTADELVAEIERAIEGT